MGDIKVVSKSPVPHDYQEIDTISISFYISDGPSWLKARGDARAELVRLASDIADCSAIYNYEVDIVPIRVGMVCDTVVYAHGTAAKHDAH